MSLDDYITSGGYQDTPRERACNCGAKFMMSGVSEYGVFQADSEEEWICPECGHDTKGDE